MIHVDLDAFYCQVEAKRLGIPRDQPLAVQQWDGLIAVSYAARAAGVTRHMRVREALKVCPQLQCVHVRTIGEQHRHRSGRGRAWIFLDLKDLDRVITTMLQHCATQVRVELTKRPWKEPQPNVERPRHACSATAWPASTSLSVSLLSKQRGELVCELSHAHCDLLLASASC